jgi:hypothetical protein
MKSVLILSTLFLFSLSTASAQWARSSITYNSPVEYTLAAMKINANPSSIIEKFYNYQDGKLADKPDWVMTTVFNDKGQVASREVINLKRIKYDFKYDNSGRPVEMRMSGDTTTLVTSYRYSENGNTTRKDWLRDGRIVYFELFTYYQSGRLAEWSWNTSNGMPFWHYKYAYNSDGSIYEIIQKGDLGQYNEDLDGKFYEYKYDSKKNVLSVKRMENGEEFEEFYTYEYDSQSNWVSRSQSFTFEREQRKFRKITREYKYQDRSNSSVRSMQPLCDFEKKHLEKLKGVQVFTPYYKTKLKIDFTGSWCSDYDTPNGVKVLYRFSNPSNELKVYTVYMRIYPDKLRSIEEVNGSDSKVRYIKLSYNEEIKGLLRVLFDDYRGNGEPDTDNSYNANSCIIYIPASVSVEDFKKLLNSL